MISYILVKRAPKESILLLFLLKVLSLYFSENNLKAECDTSLSGKNLILESFPKMVLTKQIAGFLKDQYSNTSIGYVSNKSIGSDMAENVQSTSN